MLGIKVIASFYEHIYSLYIVHQQYGVRMRSSYQWQSFKGAALTIYHYTVHIRQSVMVSR